MYTPISDYNMSKKYLTLDMNDNVELYFNNLEKSVLEMKTGAMAICLDINIPEKQMTNVLDQFAGCAIRMQSDTRDWTRYVLDDYSLVIECSLRSNESIDMWVEIKGYAIELCKQCSTLKYNEENEIILFLKDFLDDVNDWKKIKEISVVFRPARNKMVGRVIINRVVLRKLVC